MCVSFSLSLVFANIVGASRSLLFVVVTPSFCIYDFGTLRSVGNHLNILSYIKLTTKLIKLVLLSLNQFETKLKEKDNFDCLTSELE